MDLRGRWFETWHCRCHS